MTQRKLAERILEQAKNTDWCVCCLCSNFEICYKNEDINKNSHPKDCIEGIRQWLMEPNKNKEVEE